MPESNTSRFIFSYFYEFFGSFTSILVAFIFGIISPDRNKSIPRQAALNELRSIREGGFRSSERIVELWYLSLSDCINKLGYEKYAILEQVFIAALDVGDNYLASDCLDQLVAKFKNSSRINRLFGMYLESKGSFDEAQEIYTKLLNEDPTNILARKRMIAILKAQQKIPDAINELRQYLKIFMSDFEAWGELADLYLNEGDYKHAAFCMEEMILFNPFNHLYCQRYAEIKYTEGGIENLELARTYYAQACILCPGNLRSLFGLLLTCSALDSHLGKSIAFTVPVMNDKNKQKNGPLSANSPSSTVNNELSGPGATMISTNGSANNLITNNNNNRNINLSKQSNFTSTVLSGPEKNRQLAKWATDQIHSIYASAHVNPIHNLSLSKSIHTKTSINWTSDSNKSNEPLDNRSINYQPQQQHVLNSNTKDFKTNSFAQE